MKKLDRFIVRSFIAPFIAILVVVVFILMLQFLWVYIDDLVGKGLGLGIILEFLMWGACTILPLSLPLATLLASVMVVGQMSENNEMLAIKASGGDAAELARWLATDVPSREKIEAVTALYDRLGVRRICEDKMEQYYKQAVASLDNVSVSADKKQELRKLADKLMLRNE